MKIFILGLILFSTHALATFLPECGPGSFGNVPCTSNQSIHCPSGQYVTGYAGGVMCVDHLPNPATQNCPTCTSMPSRFPQYGPYNPYVMNSWPMMNYNQGPWWAAQGQFHYPNFNYPGSWQCRGPHCGINSQHYPGQGGAMMLKPNLYAQNFDEPTKFDIEFGKKELSNMLITTPALKNGTWSGNIIKDQFEVSNVEYEYLFYDYRFDHNKLQYDDGICSSREIIIKIMLDDLKYQNYPKESLKDFDEHWNQKMPKIDYYCLYPQYNKQLDETYPIATGGLKLVRSLYLVVPYEKAPRMRKGQFPSLPTKWTRADRPEVVKSGPVLKEWGVSFLVDEVRK